MVSWIDKWSKTLREFRQKLLPEIGALAFIFLMFGYGIYLILTSEFWIKDSMEDAIQDWGMTSDEDPVGIGFKPEIADNDAFICLNDINNLKKKIREII